jgi:hypothetical protein
VRIAKTLSANDVGTTGGHQAGILVPKSAEILSFFPLLPKFEKNPRVDLVVRERVSNARWDFIFIYYNNRLFGGTRNEYRLTGMTRFLRVIAASEGDELMFTKDENKSIYVELLRAGLGEYPNDGVLHLRSGWVYIDV